MRKRCELKPNAWGNAVDSAGTKVKIISIISCATIKMGNSRVRAAIGVCMATPVTNSKPPTGSGTIAMVRFTITIMAKCSGSIPKTAEMGAKMGISCFIIQRDLEVLNYSAFVGNKRPAPVI